MQLRTTDFSSDIRDGMLQSLNQAGFVDGESAHLLLKNADAQVESARQIVSDFAKARVNLIVLTGPGLLPALRDEPRSIPLLAVGASPGELAAGAQWKTIPIQLDVAPVLRLCRELLGGRGAAGLISSPDGADASGLLEALHREAPGAGVRLVSTHVTAPAELDAAMRRLKKQQARLILHLPGSTSDVWAGDLALPAEAAGMAVVSCSPDDLTDGIAAAAGFSLFEVGVRSGAVAAQLARREAAALPSDPTPAVECRYDPAAVHRLGLTRPASCSPAAQEDA